jgi:hypothetical protein
VPPQRPQRGNGWRAAWLATIYTLVMLLSVTVMLRFTVNDPGGQVAIGYLIGTASAVVSAFVGGFAAATYYRNK